MVNVVLVGLGTTHTKQIVLQKSGQYMDKTVRTAHNKAGKSMARKSNDTLRK